MRPIVCFRCGAAYGERHLLVPGDVVIKMPTPEGEVEVVRQDHITHDGCLEILAREVTRLENELREIQKRVGITTDKYNRIVEMKKQERGKVQAMPRREVQ